MLSHYDVLGVEPEASASELKKCYQQLLLRLHPDKAPGKATQFNRLQEAWTVLVDPHQRAEYDKQLKREQLYQQYPISEELFLEDLQYDSDDGSYSHCCRCGGSYSLPTKTSAVFPESEVAVLCDNCSLAIIVILPLNFPHEKHKLGCHSDREYISTSSEVDSQEDDPKAEPFTNKEQRTATSNKSFCLSDAAKEILDSNQCTQSAHENVT